MADPISSSNGYTLMEVLIALVVVALLASIAYPSYVKSMERSNRNDAFVALNQLAQDQERLFAATGGYTTDMARLSLAVADGASISPRGYYKVSASAGPTDNIRTSYRLTAVPVADGPQVGDTDCTSYAVDSSGVQTPDPATSDCW